ncbi:hypothetical protein Bca4012_074845 [Brassica carinata]
MVPRSLSTDSGKPPEVYQTDDEESLTQSDLPKYLSRTPDRRFKENSVIYNAPNIKQRSIKIACSVFRERRYQSYVAQGGPQWLSSLLEVEAG